MKLNRKETIERIGERIEAVLLSETAKIAEAVDELETNEVGVCLVVALSVNIARQVGMMSFTNKFTIDKQETLNRKIMDLVTEQIRISGKVVK